jgi:Holliday junction resolvase
MNPLDDKLITGTIGELLVQLRLLQHGVQANPPLKDSGNDLIAVKGNVIKVIQVKTTTTKRGFEKPKDRLYHIVAFVRLKVDGDKYLLDQSDIFLIPLNKLLNLQISDQSLEPFRINQEHIDHLFTSQEVSKP